MLPLFAAIAVIIVTIVVIRCCLGLRLAVTIVELETWWGSGGTGWQLDRLVVIWRLQQGDVDCHTQRPGDLDSRQQGSSNNQDGGVNSNSNDSNNSTKTDDDGDGDSNGDDYNYVTQQRQLQAFSGY
ncbi:hypothetical protein EDB89DRAFT_1904085 [Lactarius sanguifluus]|nr:hypothetical protein EDB89DRAFT_1904085 [Lactarius sanguifluus]